MKGKMQKDEEIYIVSYTTEKESQSTKLISDKINFRGRKIIRIKKGIT